MLRYFLAAVVGIAIGTIAAIAISESLNHRKIADARARSKLLETKLVERDEQLREVTAQRDEGAGLLRQVLEKSKAARAGGQQAPTSKLTTNPLDQVRNADPGYSLVRLNWVAHDPSHAVAEGSPLLQDAGLVEVEKGHIPLTLRLAEGEALGIGRGLSPRFPYLLTQGTRGTIVDDLRKAYSGLVVLDESNGASGETHVAHLRPGLSAAIFGSWYNPWSIVVVSAMDTGRHDRYRFDEWIRLCVALAKSPDVTAAWLAGVRSKSIKVGDGVALYSAWTWQDDHSPREMLVFSITSVESPIRIGLRED
jgi:hypothetical protein